MKLGFGNQVGIEFHQGVPLAVVVQRLIPGVDATHRIANRVKSSIPGLSN